MKEFILYIALLTALICVDAEKWQTAEDGSRYYIETELKYNWYEAFHECARRNATLFIIDTLGKHEKMEKLFKKVLANVFARLYMAGHDNAAGGHKYVWLSTGREFSFTRWETGEPNHSHEHCAEVHSASMTWNNVPCDTKLGFACEESPLNQDLNALKSLLKTKEHEVNTVKKTCDGQIQELKEQTTNNSGSRKFFESQLMQLSKEKTELLTALTKCYESQKNVTVTPNKYYNVVVNPQKCAHN